MAKAAAKTTAKKATKKPQAPRATASSDIDIEKVSAEAMEKLRELGIEEQLQRDIQWCLGSYQADQNPVGLYGNAEKALSVLKSEKEKKTKGVTAKLISDLEKLMKDQPR